MAAGSCAAEPSPWAARPGWSPRALQGVRSLSRCSCCVCSRICQGFWALQPRAPWEERWEVRARGWSEAECHAPHGHSHCLCEPGLGPPSGPVNAARCVAVKSAQSGGSAVQTPCSLSLDSGWLLFLTMQSNKRAFILGASHATV